MFMWSGAMHIPNVGAFRLESSNRKRTCLPVTLEWPGEARKTSALLDSGAEESFLNATTAAQWGLVPLEEVSRPLVANSLNGQCLGRITKATRPIKMKISGNHQKEISLFIINTWSGTPHVRGGVSRRHTLRLPFLRRRRF